MKKIRGFDFVCYNWSAVIFTAPLFYYLINYFFNYHQFVQEWDDVGYGYMIMLFFSAVFSLPALMLAIIFMHFIARKSTPRMLVRFAFLVITSILLFFTFTIFLGNIEKYDTSVYRALFFAHMIPVLIFSQLIRLYPANDIAE